MSDKKLGQHFNNLSDDAKTYIKSELAFYKLDAYKKLIKATSSILRIVINSGIIVLMLTFLSIGVALLIGKLIGYYYVGFLIIAGFYLLILILMSLFGKRWVEKTVLKIYNNIFEDI